MEHQPSFAEMEFSRKKKQTRREKFLDEMDQVVPWKRLAEIVEPVYPKGERGRPPIGLERMLRVYFLQQWYALSDEAIEDAIYDSHAMSRFARITVGAQPVPDATTLLKFRHLLEEHHLTQRMFERVNEELAKMELLMKVGSMVDATIISAPSSTKNVKGERDPEMHQTRKGEQWYFGMKAHIGADVDSGLVHTLRATAANVSDIAEVHGLLHGQEEEVYADAGYQGVEKRAEIQQKHPKVMWHVAVRRGKITALPEGTLKELAKGLERTKARVRAFVEHPFHVLKNLFGYRKVRYRGLAKNQAHLYTLFTLVNLFLARRCIQAAR